MVRSIALLCGRMPYSAMPHLGLREAEEARGRRETCVCVCERVREGGRGRGSHRIDMLDRKEPDTTLHCTALHRTCSHLVLTLDRPTLSPPTTYLN